MTNYPAARGLSGILRRCGAGCYDGLLVTGLAMVTLGGATLLTRASGTPGALSAYPYTMTFRVLDVLVIGAYFGFSWTRSGETLGMKAWGLRLVTGRGYLPDWRHSALRLLIAVPLWLMPVAGLLMYMAHRASVPAALAAALPLALSLGLAWRNGISLHDRLSDTRILRVPRDAPVAAAPP